MPELAVARAAHLTAYLEAMRTAGIPVDSRLGRSKLPVWIENTPDEYVSIPLALEFIAECGRELHPGELAFLAVRHSTFATLSPVLQRAVALAQTGYARMQAMVRLAHRENNLAVVRMDHHSDEFRIVVEMSPLASHPLLCFSEWLNLQALISIVRSVAGQGWHPPEMTLVSQQAPSDAAREAFGNTRILVGQPQSSIVVETDVLARTVNNTSTKAVVEQMDVEFSENWTLADILRSVVRPYLAGGYLDIDQAAEIIGLSTRTLQRRLQAAGRSYGELVQEARFTLAHELLSDPLMTITDISFAAGYQNPQHFSRAFKRLTGITPKSFRARTDSK